MSRRFGSDESNANGYNCDKFKLNSNIYSKNINYNYDKMKRYLCD